nr:MAG TPA: hypothetical protein [Caudoviricetes sp.]
MILDYRINYYDAGVDDREFSLSSISICIFFAR